MYCIEEKSNFIYRNPLSISIPNPYLLTPGLLSMDYK